MTPFPGTLQREVSHCHAYLLTDEQREWLAETFPVTENERVIKAMGISYPTLYNMVNRLGIRKTKEGLRAIRQRKAELHKRMCRQERLRLLGGGRPQCCQNIRLQPFTKSQISRRNKAVKLHGYIVKPGALLADNDPDRWVIFYNKKTKRSPTFERNGTSDGFIFKEL